MIPTILEIQSEGPYFKIGLYHDGYSHLANAGALAAIPPANKSLYFFNEKAVWPPAKLPPYKIQGVCGALRFSVVLTPGNVAC